MPLINSLSKYRWHPIGIMSSTYYRRRDWNILCCQRAALPKKLTVSFWCFSLTTRHASTAGGVSFFALHVSLPPPAFYLHKHPLMHLFIFFIFRNPTTPDEIKKIKKTEKILLLQKTADESTSRLWLFWAPLGWTCYCELHTQKHGPNKA